MSQQAGLQLLDFGGGLYVSAAAIASLVEIERKEDSVTITYFGGGTRTLTGEQMKSFLTQTGLEQQRVQPARVLPGAWPPGPRPGRA